MHLKKAMYSSQKNILQLVSLLKAHKVNQIVVSSGSRNAPVIQSLGNDAFFTCHTVVDERSAGFYALGIAQYTKETVAVCCTSGTAVLNYGPAVAEAYYRQLPLVVITADRPAAWIGQGMGQTLPQPGIFNTLAKCSVQLPDINSQEDEWYCNRLINEALLEATHHRCGPVHINIPLSEPLFEYAGEQLPQVRAISRYLPLSGSFSDYGRRFLMYRKRMLIVGQSVDPHVAYELDKLIEAHDCVILTEHLSNIPSTYCIRNFDAILCSIPENEPAHYVPDLLITVGGHIVSKRIKQFLRANPPQEHWHISPSGEIVDTYQCLTDVVEAESVDFIRYLSRQAEDKRLPKLFTGRWLSHSIRIPEPKVEFSDIMAIGALLKAMPENAGLLLANGSSVRLAQLFRLQGCPEVFSNRGTSGIDGCLSTAIGQAAVSKDLTFLLIGDLAFFYDMNILWNRLIPPRMRILLNNNGGGGIFHTLPGFEKSGITEKHITVRHAVSAKAWAEDQGFTYLSVSGEPELHAHMPAFVRRDARKPVLMEVFTSKEKNAEILQNYYASLRII
jgi:2-succinyl-5-enolpyruvyl-6-hydroxy-3-cyclohexene-1-carboxylate synthase